MVKCTLEIVNWREFIMSRVSGKNSWVLFLMILAGIVLGGLIGYLTKEVSFLTWLNYGQDFGIGGTGNSGIVRLNLGVMIISFGLTIKINVASIIGIAVAIIIYKKI
jgi:hypothetical protein